MRVLYPGGFDLLHAGHIKALHAAREIAGPGGHLTVAVNSDKFMVQYKRTPARAETHRVNDVESTGIPHKVTIWHGPEGQDKQILTHHPDIYIAGVDWLTKDLAAQLDIPSLAWFDEHNISLLFLRRTPGISTTWRLEPC